MDGCKPLGSGSWVGTPGALAGMASSLSPLNSVSGRLENQLDFTGSLSSMTGRSDSPPPIQYRETKLDFLVGPGRNRSHYRSTSFEPSFLGLDTTL